MGYKTSGMNDLYYELRTDLYYELRTMTRYVIAFISLFGSYTSAWAQQPAPQAIHKTHGGTGHVVGIRGTGFGGDKTKLKVFFGAAQGVVESATDQFVEATIPPGATYDNISVTHTTSFLTGYTPQNFLLSFGGDFGFDANNLGPQQDFPTEAGLFDQCLCDFNGDGKVDVVTASQNTATAAVFTNTSTVGAISFNKNVIPITGRPFHVKCGDLNGDSKPDLVFSEAGNGERIFILQNNTSGSTISFLPTIQVLTLPGKKPKQIQIGDLDLDGKPEIVVSDLKQTGSTGTVNIIVNQSANGTMIFSPTVISLSVPGTTSSDGLSIKDLNDDGRPEIVTSKYADTQSNIFIAANKSTSGNISFDAFVTLTVNGGVSVIKIGDLDGDGKPDIAMSLFLINAVGVMRNTSTSTTLSFATAVTFAADQRANGLDIGDIDGDGKPDLVSASINAKTLTFLNNISSPGSFSFQPQTKTTNEINRHVNLGDMDGDGKPDVVFTSTDNSNLSVFRNKTCMVPRIEPEGPLTICSGSPLQLRTASSPGTTFTWELNGSTQSNTPNPYFDVTAAGSYTVIAKAEGGTCTKVSNSVSVSISGTGSGTVTLPTLPPVCRGSEAQIIPSGGGPGLSYKWTGPNNYTSSNQNASVPDFQAIKSGRYYLDVYAGGGTCLYQQLSTVVDVIDLGNFSISYSNGTMICQGDAKVLSVPTGFSYQWRKDGTDVGTNVNTYSANASGDYTVKITPLGCSAIETDPVSITVLTAPTAIFSTDPVGSACQGQLVGFKNNSVVDAAATPVYKWEFGDSQISNDKEPSHQYTGTGAKAIKLTVSYAGCSDDESGSITITTATPIQIINPVTTGLFKFCEGDSLKLTVPGTLTAYEWSTGETSAAIYVKTGGVYSVNATNPDGCKLFDDQLIATDPAPQIEVKATPPQINEGESTQLEASAGLTDYHWTPDDGTLSAINNATPTATPLVTTTYLVSASSGAGCPGRGSIEVVVRGEPIVNKLAPGKFFSPNGDDKNATWLVDKIEDFSQCGVSIYDDKGIKVFEAKPYLNNWDGTFKGKKLPDGVYYYIIRCDGEESKPRTGSITVLR